MELQGDFSTCQRNNYKYPSSKAVRLQWRWQELRDRERRAQQHNTQLLQEFERAQDTLREMMARTAAMKMIRMEYARFLDESSPCWQQQQLMDEEPAQKKKIEKHLKECLKRMEERQATQPPIEAELPFSKGQKNNQKGTVPKQYYSQNGHLDYNLDGTAYQRIQSSWLTHTSPDRTSSYLQGSSHVPRPPSHSSPVFPHQAQPVQPYQLPSASTYHPTIPLQGPPLWAATQTDCPFSWGGPGPRVPWTQPSVSECPSWGMMQQGVEERVERCTGSNPKEELGGDERWRGDSSNHRSQELDIKPVRLSSGHGESSVTNTDSSQASRKSSRNRNKREERSGRAGRSSTDEDGSCQHAAAFASASADQSSESDGSLEISNGRSRRSVVQSVTPSRVEKSREKNRSKRSDSGSRAESTSVRTESGSQPEEPVISGNQSPGDKSVSNRESVSHIQESESVNTRTGDGGDTEDTVSQKSISAEQRSMAEDEGEKGKEEVKGEEDSNGDDECFEENKESSQQEEARERENDKGERFVRESLPENGGEEDDEDETEGHGSEGGEEDGEQSDDESVEKDYSSTTQDREMEGDRAVGSEDSREGEEDDASDEGEGGAEEDEQRSEDDVGKDSQAAEPEKERDSDSDSIISPQNHRSKRNIHTIPEEVEEIIVDDKESQKDCTDRSSNESSDEEDDIENLLAPQAAIEKREEKVQNGSDKPKVVCEDLVSISEEPISEIKDTDSDEFDHFYD